MATITAAAGGGPWSVGSTWVGSVAPTANDDVLLTITSGNITIDGTSGSPNVCNSLDCTGYTGTLTQASAKVLNIGKAASVNGNFKLVAGMTYVPNAAATINFLTNLTTSCNITCAGKTLPITTFGSAGGGVIYSLQDAFAAASILHQGGTFTTNNNSINAASFISTAALQTINLGSSTITLSGSGWDLSGANTPTINAGTSSIVLTGANGANFVTPSKTYYNITISNINAACNFSPAGSTFNNVTFSALSSSGKIVINANFTVNGTLFLTGAASGKRLSLFSDTVGTARTITAAAITAVYVDLRDITGAGAGSWNLSAITGGSGDCGGNSGITFNTPGTYYYYRNTGNIDDASKWFLASGGTGGAGRAPLPQDTARFDANSFSLASQSISFNVLNIPFVDFTGTTNTPFLSFGSGLNFANSATFISALGAPSAGFSFAGRGSFTFNTGGLSFSTCSITVDTISSSKYTLGADATFGNITFNAGEIDTNTHNLTTGQLLMNTTGGKLTLTGTLTGNSTFSYTAGSIIATSNNITGFTTATINGSLTLACNNFTCSSTFQTTSATITASGTITSAGMTINSGSVSANALTCTSISLVTGTLTITNALTCSSVTFTGGTISMGSLSCTGALSFSSGASTTITGAATGTTCSLSNTSSALSFGSMVLSSSMTCSGGTLTIGSGGLQATTFTSTSGVRTISFGSGTITLTSTGTVFSMSTGGTLTVSANTATVELSDTSATAKTAALGTVNYNGLSFQFDGGASQGNQTITGASPTIKNLILNADCLCRLTAGITLTLTGTIISNGTSGHLALIKSVTNTSAATISCANTVDVDFMSIRDNTASGNTPFYAGTHSTNVSGNTNWTFTARPGAVTFNALLLAGD